MLALAVLEQWYITGLVTLPLNVSLDLGSRCGAQHCNATAGVIVRRAFESEFFVE